MDTTRKTRFVKATEVANILNIGITTVRRWAKQGKIPSIILPNKQLRFDVRKIKIALTKHPKTKADTGFSAVKL